MDLYLIRHADAVALGENGITEDPARPLSEAGDVQSRRIARALHKRGVALERLLTSPLVRARQTAEGMLKTWHGNPPELINCDDLAPGGKPRKLARFLKKLDAQHIGLVGHMPHIADWTAWLIGSKKARLDFAKAGIAYLTCTDDLQKGDGVLQWLVTPEWFES